MNIYDITLPVGCDNLDGFDIKPFGNLQGRLLRPINQDEPNLFGYYKDQIKNILEGSLHFAVEDSEIDTEQVSQIIIDVNNQGVITMLTVADSGDGDIKETPNPTLSSEQMFDVLRLFYLVSCLHRLSDLYPSFYLSLDDQRDFMKASFGEAICTEHSVRFESTSWGGLKTFVKKGEGEILRDLTGIFTDVDIDNKEFFPRIYSPSRIAELEQSNSLVEKVVAAAKNVLGSRADLNTILMHFQAHPDGAEGSRAILDNKLRTKQVRRNIM